jgi:HSP20 family protein
MAREKEKEKERKGEGRETALMPYRPFFGLSPFREMERMFEELMGRRTWMPFFPEELAAPMPAIDVYDEENEVVVKAELPGINKEDLEVNITDHTVTITGEKKEEKKVERKDYYRHERSYGSFTRSIPLPEDVEIDRSKATFKEGVLEVRVPHSEEAKKKRKKIEIE